jgi:Na+/melibiose symporter-like transporter
MNDAVSARPRRTFLDRVGYGIGSLAFGVKDNGFGTLLIIFYNQALGLPAALVGAAITISLVVDAIMDPMIGHVSDNWRSRWGRRHPFMYASIIPVCLGFLFLWNPPEGLSQTGLFLYLVFLSIAVRFSLSLYEIPSYSLVVDLAEDYDERTSFLSFRSFFSWLSGLVMAVAAFQVFLKPTPQQPNGQLNLEGYANYGVVSAVIMFAAMLGSAIATHRHIKTFRPLPPRQRLRPAEAAMQVYRAVSHRPFLIMVGVGLFGAMAAGLAGSMLVYFRLYFWGLTTTEIAYILYGNFASVAVGVVLANLLSKGMGKKWGAMLMAFCAMTVNPTLYMLRVVDVLPPNGSDTLLAILIVASFFNTIFTVVSMILGGAMMADVVEDAQIKTGHQSPGLYFAANSFALQCVSGVGIMLATTIIQLSGFPVGAKAGEVPQAVLNRMVLYEVPILLALYTMAIVFIGLYPISRARHNSNLKTLGLTDDAPPKDAVPDVA